MTTPTIPIVFGGLIAWSVYRRVRRNIGRQPLRPVRIIISLVIFSLVTVMLIFGSLALPKLLLGISSGVALGVGLGFLGLRLTKFETTEAGHFYTPNTSIGVGLSLLFVGRIIYRFWVLSNVAAEKGQPQPQLFQSPLTLLIFGLIAGYYIVYYIGLFVHTHDKVVPKA
jgi:hypothetical protein